MRKLSEALLASPKIQKTMPGLGGPTWPTQVHDFFDSLWVESKMPKSKCPECENGPWDLDLILSHLVDIHDYSNAQLAQFVSEEKNEKAKARKNEK